MHLGPWKKYLLAILLIVGALALYLIYGREVDGGRLLRSALEALRGQAGPKTQVSLVQGAGIEVEVPVATEEERLLDGEPEQLPKKDPKNDPFELRGSGVGKALYPKSPLYIEETPKDVPVVLPQGPCDWSTFGLPAGEVVLNELAWMGSEDSSDEEWLEIKNVSGREMDISGWQVQNKSGKLRIVLPDKRLAAGEIFVMHRSNDVAPKKNFVNDIYAGELKNSGDWLKIFNKHCNLVDEIDARSGWPKGSVFTGQTMERAVASLDWQDSISAGGSPGAQNFVPLSVPATDGPGLGPAYDDPVAGKEIGTALIFSVQISGSGSDDDRVVIYNLSADSMDVSGWKIRKRSRSGSESSIKVLAGEMQGHGYFTWANSRHDSGADATSTQTLSADSSIALIDPEGRLVDAVAWGTGHNVPYIEGTAYPLNPEAGQVLSRKVLEGAVIDSDNNAVDFELRP